MTVTGRDADLYYEMIMRRKSRDVPIEQCKKAALKHRLDQCVDIRARYGHEGNAFEVECRDTLELVVDDCLAKADQVVAQWKDEEEFFKHLPRAVGKHMAEKEKWTFPTHFPSDSTTLEDYIAGHFGYL
jgi:hypothetical protein